MTAYNQVHSRSSDELQTHKFLCFCKPPKLLRHVWEWEAILYLERIVFFHKICSPWTSNIMLSITCFIWKSYLVLNRKQALKHWFNIFSPFEALMWRSWVWSCLKVRSSSVQQSKLDWRGHYRIICCTQSFSSEQSMFKPSWTQCSSSVQQSKLDWRGHCRIICCAQSFSSE